MARKKGEHSVLPKPAPICYGQPMPREIKIRLNKLQADQFSQKLFSESTCGQQTKGITFRGEKRGCRVGSEEEEEKSRELFKQPLPALLPFALVTRFVGPSAEIMAIRRQLSSFCVSAIVSASGLDDILLN